MPVHRERRTSLADFGVGEIALPGGRLTEGVVRVGDTVRRPPGPSSPFVARLLAHLEASGFAGAPRHLGSDDRGRDVFSYVPGCVPTRLRRFTDAQVRHAGVLLRAFHDATRGSTLAGGHAVVCHHDAGPYNTVFQDGRPVAFIDFDMAAPGEPLEDLGYVAWLWCVSSKPERRPVGAQAAQVRTLADAYGLGAAERGGIVDAMLQRQSRNSRFWQDRLAGPDERMASIDQVMERVAWSERERAYTEASRADFAAALR